jgi:NADH:ubiquinone oxidoreductase subunit F (NADH-binding)
MTVGYRRAPAAPFQNGLLLAGLVRYAGPDRDQREGPRPDRLGDHLFRYGDRPRTAGSAGEELLAALDQLSLTGRGGAHFSTAIKWRTVLAAGGHGYVIANAAEGEPASAKDTALLRHRPHLVLDGLAGAAEALSAIGSVVWLHSGAVETHQALTQALHERRAAGLVEPPVQLVTGPDHYLSGESSAVVRALSGGPARPTFSRVPTARAGLAGLPTLIQNVDTLARIGLIARTGTLGSEPGPLVTILDDAGLTVCELPPQITLADAVALARPAGLEPPAPQAVLLGGYGGSWLAWPEAAGLVAGNVNGRWSPAAAGPVPTRRRRLAVVPAVAPSLGAGVIVPLPPAVCGLAETAAVLDYLARSSARQCGPCLFGTRALADGMLRIVRGAARRKEVDQLLRLTDEVDGRGACGLPDGAAELARSALAVFAADVERHVRRRDCLHLGGRAILPVPGGVVT